MARLHSPTTRRPTPGLPTGLRCPAGSTVSRPKWVRWRDREEYMAATVRAAIRELMEQTMATMDALLEASDRELPMSSSHACAQGKNVLTSCTQRHRSRKDPHRAGPRRALRVAAHGIADAAPGRRVACGANTLHWFTHRPYGRAVQQRHGPWPVDLPRRGEARAHAGAGFAQHHRHRPGGEGEQQVGTWKRNRAPMLWKSPIVLVGRQGLEPWTR